MAQLTRLMTPANIILAGLVLFVLAKFGAFGITLSTVNLINASSNQSYACNTTFECYTLVSGQITGTASGPALACINQTCRISYCDEDVKTTKDCWDGTKVTLRSCINGTWNFADAVCPPPECTKNSDCISAFDKDCDTENEPIFGVCAASKCSYTESAPRCSDTQLFFNKWKWQLLAGALIILGIGGFIYAAPRKIKLF